MSTAGSLPRDDGALRGISSMATKAVLLELVGLYQSQAGNAVALESVGGVDAAARVRNGEPFDFVILARDAIDALLSSDKLERSTAVDLFRSEVAVAVRSGSVRPDIHDEAALRNAVLNARSVGISTGPSGVALQRSFERWGIARQIADRVVVPAPGIAVGTLIARGEVELGFQQYSELLGVAGVEVLGMLPEGARIVTVFSGALTPQARAPEVGNHWLSFLASTDATPAKQRHGMLPA